MGEQAESRPILQVGQMVEVISADIPAHMGLRHFDGSQGKIKRINERRIAWVEIASERDDSPSGNIHVPEAALRLVEQ